MIPCYVRRFFCSYSCILSKYVRTNIFFVVLASVKLWYELIPSICRNIYLPFRLFSGRDPYYMGLIKRVHLGTSPSIHLLAKEWLAFN